jgi:hypothetical protein
MHSNPRTVRAAVFMSACNGAGAVWLYAVLYVILGKVILRETTLGKLAEQIDRLPPGLATPIFVLFWCVFLFGWSVPVALGLIRLFRKPRISNS